MSNTTPPPSGYLVPPPSGPGPARPSTVTFASMLLYLLAVIQLIAAGLAIYATTFYTSDAIVQIYEDAGAPSDVAEASAPFVTGAFYATAAFGVIFAALYIVLAIFVGQGKQWARITTWVIAGLSLCCGVFGLAGTAFSNSLSNMGGGAGEFDQQEVTDRIAALAPAWMEPVQLGLGIVAIVANILVIVLLLLPPSQPYFRRAEPEWTPPTYPAP